MEKISIRRATHEDLEAITEIYRVVFIPHVKPNFSALLREDVIFYVAVIDDKIAGFIVANIEHEKAFILLLAVHPNFRRRGLAKALLKKLLDDLRSKGVKRVLLEVSTSNLPAINLYRKFGFKIKDLRFDHYIDTMDSIDDVYVMERVIRGRSDESESGRRRERNSGVMD